MGPSRCDLGGALRTALGRRQGQWPPRRGAARGSIKVPCPLYLAAGLTAGSGTGRPGHSPPRWPQHLPLAWLTAESGSLRFPELGCRDRGERDRPGAGSTKPAARSRQRDSSQCRTQIDGNHSQRPGKCQGGPGLRHRGGGAGTTAARPTAASITADADVAPAGGMHAATAAPALGTRGLVGPQDPALPAGMAVCAGGDAWGSLALGRSRTPTTVPVQPGRSQPSPSAAQACRTAGSPCPHPHSGQLCPSTAACAAPAAIARPDFWGVRCS